MAGIDWSGVPDRLAALASQPVARTLFGAERHRFALNPVLTVAELHDLEDSVGVTLPQDYRSFLLEVGNGGAGPGFGIERVMRTADGWRWTANDDAAVANLGVAFPPFGPQVSQEHERTRPAEEDFPDLAAYSAACQAWLEREDDLYVQESYGTLAIAAQGCGHSWRLVVSGPHRGEIWDDARGSDVPLTPLAGFGRWYLDWLDDAQMPRLT